MPVSTRARFLLNHTNNQSERRKILRKDRINRRKKSNLSVIKEESGESESVNVSVRKSKISKRKRFTINPVKRLLRYYLDVPIKRDVIESYTDTVKNATRNLLQDSYIIAQNRRSDGNSCIIDRDVNTAIRLRYPYLKEAISKRNSLSVLGKRIYQEYKDLHKDNAPRTVTNYFS